MSTRLLRLPDVCRITGLSRSGIYRLVNQGRFPKPRKLAQRASAWREDEVLEWIDSRPVAGQVGETT